jgi:hypothetical protein
MFLLVLLTVTKLTMNEQGKFFLKSDQDSREGSGARTTF